MHSRQRAVYQNRVTLTTILLRAAAVTLSLAIASHLAARPALAQAPDTAVVDTAGPRPEIKPPISPRRAFLYSLMLPGYAQSILGRGKSGTLILGFETAAIVMLRESSQNLRDARRFLNDSIPVSFVDANGNPQVRWERTPFSRDLVQTRREQVEDWIAVLVANHLFAAADAYVAALLWDLPVEVAASGSRSSATLAMRVRW